jgi:protein SCO1/2
MPFRRLDAFFGGAAFPLVSLSLLASGLMLAVTLLAIPPGSGPMGAFAEEFRAWCFGAAPGGGLQWGFVAAVLLSPMLVGTFILLIWWSPLRVEVARRPRVVVVAGLSSIVFAAACGLSLALLGTGQAGGDLPFPAESIRTTIDAPKFALTDQDGRTISPAALHGRVVLLTGIYSRCGSTCPMIFAQAQRAVEQLSESERAQLAVVAVTLDPEHDDVERMKALADGHGIGAPLWHLTTGDTAPVNDLLDRLGIERRRDPATGIIEHANMFILVDRQGRIAFRLTLGDRQERWLVSALRLLVQERASTS